MIPAADAGVEDDKEEEKKRHLNVVFIGHVGRLILFVWFIFWMLRCSYISFHIDLNSIKNFKPFSFLLPFASCCCLSFVLLQFILKELLIFKIRINIFCLFWHMNKVLLAGTCTLWKRGVMSASQNLSIGRKLDGYEARNIVCTYSCS